VLRSLIAVAALAVAVSALAGCGGGGSTQTTSSASADASRQADIKMLELQTRHRKLQEELARAKAAARRRRASAAQSGASTGSGGLLGPGASASFAALERELGGSSGLGVAPAGRGQSPQTVGTLTSGSAWSTMKVPVAIAADAAGKADQSLVTRAITASDNSAAESLWSALGSPSQAGAATEHQLAAAGDSSTRVQTQVVRSGFSSFGQTDWSLDAQTRFVAGLPCVPDAGPVLNLMQQVEGDQRWGLGTLGGSPAFKGGWGPGTDGGYLVRQMGIVRIGGKPVALTIINKPASGSFDAGTSNLSRIASWAAEHVKTGSLPDQPQC